MTLQTFADTLAYSSEHTRDSYLRSVSRFLLWAGTGPHDATQLLEYQAHLQHQKFAQASIHLTMAAIKRYYKHMHWQWPGVSIGQQASLPGPRLKPEEVRLLIAKVKDEGTPRQQTLLCLSTIYGLRREEIRRIVANKSKLINLQSHELLIPGDVIRKHGRPHRHIIPIGLEEYLQAPQEDIPATSMSAEFHRIVKMVRKPVAQEGWHSIRRSLVTALMQTEVNPAVVYAFLRWQAGGMLRFYFLPGDEEIDQQIMPFHPFLSTWRVGA